MDDLDRLYFLVGLMRSYRKANLEPMPRVVQEMGELADKLCRQSDPKLDNWVQRAAIVGINPEFPSG